MVTKGSQRKSKSAIRAKQIEQAVRKLGPIGDHLLIASQSLFVEDGEFKDGPESVYVETKLLNSAARVLRDAFKVIGDIQDEVLSVL